MMTKQVNIASQNTTRLHSFFFFSCYDSPPVGHGLLIHEVCFSRSHMTHHSR